MRAQRSSRSMHPPLQTMYPRSPLNQSTPVPARPGPALCSLRRTFLYSHRSSFIAFSTRRDHPAIGQGNLRSFATNDLWASLAKQLQHFRETGCFERLLKIASTEPPRIRAILGAIAEQLGKPKAQLAGLRQSLNPLSRFDFGHLQTLAYAKTWQAKDRNGRQTV